MPKYNLLKLVQKTAVALNVDSISTIGETDESLDIASLAEDVYYEIISKHNWPHLSALAQATSSVDYPNYLRLPEAVRRVESVRYNCIEIGGTKPIYKEMKYKHKDDFLATQNLLDTTKTNVVLCTDPSGVQYPVYNDKPPTYYTSFDEEWLAFDSFDSSEESNLQQSKTQLIVIREPVWSSTDEFIPDLPVEAFPLLLSELISTASVTLNQEANQKEEQKAARQTRRMVGNSYTVNNALEIPNYGRASRK